jgi:hypothetical protein
MIILPKSMRALPLRPELEHMLDVRTMARYYYISRTTTPLSNLVVQQLSKVQPSGYMACLLDQCQHSLVPPTTAIAEQFG